MRILVIKRVALQAGILPVVYAQGKLALSDLPASKVMIWLVITASLDVMLAVTGTMIHQIVLNVGLLHVISFMNLSGSDLPFEPALRCYIHK